ncbi:hypothetical protein LOTGIDRAFT_174577 [Lottia gigantea]|uniref:Uncharacterized protein n=1 Tax=Lottia gigantea TaxID=225164 RepID=V4A017_LOTGI|nr:hypothetical protein LOTGIDRAFT_174577 [Lottia gigantea]ESO97143.1 hypothetical protein LOTGIDRAFT_174577 [Lottia gigantea]
MDKDSYNARLLEHITGAAACFAVTVSKESGLLNVFLEPHEPMTVAEIAAKSNLRQRYVQEVLGCLVTSRIIQVDDNSEKYSLPPELRTCLKGMLISFDLADHLNKRTEDLKSLLDPNGIKGYPTHSRGNIGDKMDELVNTDINGTIDGMFLRSTPDIQQKLETGIDFLEFGCGQGALILAMAEKFPNTRFLGVDISKDAVAVLEKEIQKRKLANLRVEQGDILKLDEKLIEKFDMVHIHDVLHDMGDSVKGAENIKKVVKPGGIVNIIEIVLKGNNHKENIEDPMAPQMYGLSSTVCIPESHNQSGTPGMGCTSGMKGIKEMLTKAGYPLDKLVINKAQNPLLYRFTWYK